LTRVYLSLGSNVGDRLGHLQHAVALLNEGGVRVLRVSRVYETEPYGVRNQSWFLNLALEAETQLFPMQLLKRIHSIERALKRRRTVRNGPRSIDIDIVFYGNARIKTAALEIPHPRYRHRAFVLAPLSDLIPTGLPFHPPRVYCQSIGSSSPSRAESGP
jgi:2-amino-4-hydroxy-6-hydroxymethyldihydropteridine diphosphokinase